MTQEEIIRLVMQITGTKDIKAAGDELAKLKERIESVRTENEKAGKSFGSAGVQIGRFVQDASAGFGMNGLQGAIMATSNNVEGLLMGLGLGGGIAGALTLIMGIAPLVMVALKDIFNNEPVRTFSDRVDELRARLEELEKKPIKVTADTSELERVKAEIDALTKAKQALDLLMGAQTAAEKESGQAVTDALVSTPGASDAMARVVERAKAEALANSDEVAAARARAAQADRTLEGAQQDAANARGPSMSAQAQAFLRKSEQAAQDARAALADEEARARRGGESGVGAIAQAAQSGKGMDQRRAQQQLGQMFVDAGADDIANRIGLAGVGGSGVRAGGSAAFGAMGQQMAETAKANREAADLTAQGLANEEAFRRKEEKRAEAQEGEDRKAREENRRRVEKQAQQFGADNPAMGPQVQADLMQMGNSPDAVRAMSERLQQGGVDADVANTYVNAQSQELLQKLNRALSVTGNTIAAQNAIMGELIRMTDQMLESYQRNQFDMLQNGRSLQRMGR